MIEIMNQNNATIILEWMQKAGVSYNVSVNPNPLESKLNETMNQLMIYYNTSYKVSVVATLCGKHMNKTDIDITVDRLGEFDGVYNPHFHIVLNIIYTITITLIVHLQYVLHR